MIKTVRKITPLGTKSKPNVKTDMKIEKPRKKLSLPKGSLDSGDEIILE